MWEFVHGSIALVGIFWVQARTGCKLASTRHLHTEQGGILIDGRGDKKQGTFADHCGDEDTEGEEDAHDDLHIKIRRRDPRCNYMHFENWQAYVSKLQQNKLSRKVDRRTEMTLGG